MSSVSFSDDCFGTVEDAGIEGGDARIPVVAWNSTDTDAGTGRSVEEPSSGIAVTSRAISSENAASGSESRSSRSSSEDSDPESDSSSESDGDDDDWISRAGLGEIFTPEACGSAEHLDFLRFAIGALRHIAKSSPQMVDGVLISKAAAVPIHAAHAIRACTLWTVEVRARWNMMKRDPLAFVKGGRREGEEPAHCLQLRLQQLQLNCCLLMSVLTSASDAAV